MKTARQLQHSAEMFMCMSIGIEYWVLLRVSFVSRLAVYIVHQIALNYALNKAYSFKSSFTEAIISIRLVIVIASSIYAIGKGRSRNMD